MAQKDKWEIKQIPNRREGRRSVWQVTCPLPPVDLTWDNDFGRGMRCGCRRFPSEGKATRYVERMEAQAVVADAAAPIPS